MKKTLSIFLVVAMLVCMIPAFGIFAAEADYTTIDSADEFVAFANAVNDGSYTASGTITVTADLDMEGKNYAPINLLTCTLDFGGHTVSNLNVNLTGATGELGMIAHKTNNHLGVTNLKLKDCSLTVDDKGEVIGGVLGRADRAYVENISMENVTISYSGTGKVGGVIGNKHWSTADHDLMVVNMKNVTIDAPKATVGIAIADMAQWGTESLVADFTGSNIDVTIKGAANAVTEDTFVAGVYQAEVKGVSAATVKITNDTPAYKYLTIDSAQEFADFTKAINAGEISPSGTVKVTKDLDMKDITDFQPIGTLKFNLDFDGHTVSNLVVTTTGTEKDGGTYAGLIAGVMNNATMILNLNLNNCQLNATSVHIGIVAGLADRAIVPNVKIENVTLNAEGAYLVGGVVGDRQWDLDLGDREGNEADMTAELKNVVINANGATLIGILAGRTGGDARINVVTVKADNVTINNDAEGFDATKVSYVGEIGTAEKVTEAEGAVIDIALSETATGYEEPAADDNTGDDNTGDDNTGDDNTGDDNTGDDNTGDDNTGDDNTGDDNTDDKEEDKEDDKPAKTGDATLIAVALAVVALVGAAVLSKKRSAC